MREWTQEVIYQSKQHLLHFSLLVHHTSICIVNQKVTWSQMWVATVDRRFCESIFLERLAAVFIHFSTFRQRFLDYKLAAIVNICAT